MTDKIIVVVNLVVVIVFMIVVVDVVVGRALADKHHLHRHHHCCRLPPSSSLSSMSTPPDDHISLESQIFSHFCTLTEIDQKNSSQEGSHQQKKDSSVRAAPEQVDQDNMLYKIQNTKYKIQNAISAHRVFLSRWTSLTCEPRRM